MRLAFEWDEGKNCSNQQKHGIDFDTAANVFGDPDRIEIYDRNHSMEEDRYITIGRVKEVLFVVYTERKNRIRIISARLADRKEREAYYDS